MSKCHSFACSSVRRLVPAVLLLLLTVFGLNSQQALGASTLSKILAKKEIKIGMEPGFLPFEMRTKTGEYIGFDVEMMNAFAKSIGVKAKYISTKWDGIIPGLMAKKYDVIVSGMTITEARRKAVLFSDPYYKAGLGVLVSPETKKKVRDLKDLDKKNYKIVVKLGTTGDIFVGKAFSKAKVRKLDNEADAAQSVLLGRVDAFVYDRPYLELYRSSKKGKVDLLPGFQSEEFFGLAARKKDKDLIMAFNKFLKAWKADKVNGYDRSYKSIFVDMTWKTNYPSMF